MPNHHVTHVMKALRQLRRLSRAISVPSATSDMYVLCTTFDSVGRVVGVSQKFPKMQFLKQHNLFPRDLRKVDSSSVDVAPGVMVKPHAIIVNMLHIKALIQHDTVRVFDTSDTALAAKLGIFMYDLESKLKGPGAFEVKALEAMLVSVVGHLEAEMATHKGNCGSILRELEDNISRGSLQQLLIRLKKLAGFYQRAKLIRNVLEELLENDEDLHGMALSGDTTDVELVLETYYTHCDEVVQQAGALIADIRATEEIVNIILDANRNSLMLYELRVTIYTLGLTMATVVPALYGMNLKNYIEESSYGFAAVVLFSLAQGALLTMWNFKRLHRVQRLTMTQAPGSKEREVLWRMMKDGTK